MAIIGLIIMSMGLIGLIGEEGFRNTAFALVATGITLIAIGITN